MDDPQTTEIEADEPRSTAQVVESLLENAAEALTRATDCDDADWQKFHVGTAAACKELALQLVPLMSIQARIDEKTVMIRRRFQLDPSRGGKRAPTNRTPANRKTLSLRRRRLRLRATSARRLVPATAMM